MICGDPNMYWVHTQRYQSMLCMRCHAKRSRSTIKLPCKVSSWLPGAESGFKGYPKLSRHRNKSSTQLSLRCEHPEQLDNRDLYKQPTHAGKPQSSTSSREVGQRLKKFPKPIHPDAKINWRSSEVNRR